ncbi:MAG TPA: SDR family oxidoreductase [Acidimicrobiia bacterium]|nr:SDR family oxidoreductase [Acidimicrobiia bacterium]
MIGRVVIVTGANSGIGFETAVELGQMGAHVVLCARDPHRGAQALANARERAGGASFELADLDLASFASIDRFADRVLADHAAVHVLVNNAGLILKRRTTTAEGFETTFGVNHLGHFLLTSRLLDRLRASAPARIVNVSSVAHKFARDGLDFDDLQNERRYRGFVAYGRSKLANILMARELARRLAGTGVTANSLHPGNVASRFARDGDTDLMGNVGVVIGRPFAISAAAGARTSIHLASAPELAATTGEYFVKCRPVRPSTAARDDAAARRLWDVSEDLIRSTGR